MKNWDLGRVGQSYEFGKRATVMVAGILTIAQKKAPSEAGKKAPPPGLEPGTYRLTAERSAN